jgi:uncharacterized membrane protein required for colicin V production
MTIFDLFLIAVILAGGVWGLMAGASRISIAFVLVMVSVSILYAYPRISALFKGPDPVVKIFMYLLILFISLVIFGFLLRIIRNAVTAAGLGPLDKISGLAIGLITGALIVGSLIWGIETYGDGKWQSLLKDSQVSPSAMTYFRHVMAFTDRIFPQPEKPWWKRPLW